MKNSYYFPKSLVFAGEMRGFLWGEWEVDEMDRLLNTNAAILPQTRQLSTHSILCGLSDWHSVEGSDMGYSRCYQSHLSPHQYGETNVMYILFNLLRIKGLYIFRALLTHPQEVLHKRHLVY
jgi:hypothetical protein